MRAMTLVMSFTGNAHHNSVLEMIKTDAQKPPSSTSNPNAHTTHHGLTQAQQFIALSPLSCNTPRLLFTRPPRLGDSASAQRATEWCNTRQQLQIAELLLERKCCDPGPKSLCASWSCFSRSSMEPWGHTHKHTHAQSQIKGNRAVCHCTTKSPQWKCTHTDHLLLLH